jgi:predicted transcriptional regulator
MNLPNYTFKKRRDKIHIIANILEIATDGALKTQIMYKANLSFTQLKTYLKFMLKIKLLSTKILDKREIYSITSKGKVFLQNYYEMISLLQIKNTPKNDIEVSSPFLLKG